MNELTAQTSGNLTEAQRDAYRLDYEIKAEATNIVNGICRIGKCLKEIKERKLYVELGEERFEDYAENNLGFKNSAAQNYIRVYETFGDEGLERYSDLGITKLVSLSQLNDVDRKEILESGKAEELSTRELQEEIKCLKHRNEQLTFELSEAGSNSADVDKLNEEIEALKTALAEEKATKVLPAPVMSEAEKEEIRRSIEAEQEARHAKEIKEAEKAAAEKVKKKYEKELEKEKKESQAIRESNKELQLTSSKKVEHINQLCKEIAQQKAEISRLQANAQKVPPSDKKELLKFICKDIVEKVRAIPGIVAELPEEEKESAVKAVRTVAEAVTKALEGV